MLGGHAGDRPEDFAKRSQTVVKVGFLTKRPVRYDYDGKRKITMATFLGSDKRRFIILRDDGWIEWSESDDSAPLGAVQVNADSFLTPSVAELRSGGMNEFTVRIPKIVRQVREEVTLSLRSEEDGVIEDWHTAISRVLVKARPSL